MREFSLAFVVALALAFGFGFVSLALAQGSDVQIVELDCNSDPEVVVIKNMGDAAQDLIGWTLESDPLAEEAFDLLGVLQPGDLTSIALGQQDVFRDDDPTDYARIVDDTGTTIHEANCAPGAAAGPSPTPSPEPSPTPSPEPSPVASPPADVPNGGGPPPVDSALSPFLIVVVGGTMVVGSLAIVSLPALRAVASPVLGQGAAGVPREEAAPNRRPQRTRQAGRGGGKALSLASRLALIEAAVTTAVVILSSFRRGRSE